MKDYSLSLKFAITAVMMDKYLDGKSKDEIVGDLMELEEKLGDCEDCELIYPPGTGE